MTHGGDDVTFEVVVDDTWLDFDNNDEVKPKPFAMWWSYAGGLTVFFGVFAFFVVSVVTVVVCTRCCAAFRATPDEKQKQRIVSSAVTSRPPRRRRPVR